MNALYAQNMTRYTACTVQPLCSSDAAPYEAAKVLQDPIPESHLEPLPEGSK